MKEDKEKIKLKRELYREAFQKGIVDQIGLSYKNATIEKLQELLNKKSEDKIKEPDKIAEVIKENIILEEKPKQLNNLQQKDDSEENKEWDISDKKTKKAGYVVLNEEDLNRIHNFIKFKQSVIPGLNKPIHLYRYWGKAKRLFTSILRAYFKNPTLIINQSHLTQIYFMDRGKKRFKKYQYYPIFKNNEWKAPAKLLYEYVINAYLFITNKITKKDIENYFEKVG